MIISALISLVIAVPLVAGFISSRRQRTLDRRHFAVFIGFCAAIIALGATVVSIILSIVWMRPPQSPFDHPVEQGFVFVFSIVALLSTAIAFIGGLLSSGMRRVALVLFVPAMAIIYLFAAFSNFGA